MSHTQLQSPDAANPKFVRLVKRIIDDINPQYMLTLLNNDKRTRQLTEQKHKAILQKQFLKSQIIERQLMSRATEIEYEEAGRRIYELCEKGGLDAYLEKDDHDRIEALTCMVYILLDAIDSVCLDSLAVYDSYGLAPDELLIQRFTRDFRKQLDSWMGESRASGSIFEEPTRQEGDRLYEVVQQRQQVLFRKIERLRKKQEQEENKQTEGNKPKTNK